MGLFKRYKNPHIKRLKRTPVHFIAWFLGFYKDKEKTAVPEGFSYPISKREGESRATFINHCTYLIEVFGLTILTDPIWNKRCSPVSFAGPKRKHDPHMDIEEIKKLDYVFVSHNHYDHLDLPSIRRIHQHFPQVTFIVPAGLKKWFEKKGISKVIELDWWQTVRFCSKKGAQELEVAAVPAQHHSGRGFFDGNKSLWAGFVATISHKGQRKRFYFAGDTAYNEHDFKKIGKRFSDIDLSICPIGTYSPKKFMETVHLSPAGAVAIHKDIGTKLSVGMHWATFCLSEEPADAPPYDLYKEMEKNNLDHSTFLPIPPGESVAW
ncbi:MBL fold metallo-hydrolase [bacterium]|nr:MBL fold metallo-hydrolase [bacterium]